jgi:hypothetical protein
MPNEVPQSILLTLGIGIIRLMAPFMRLLAAKI